MTCDTMKCTTCLELLPTNAFRFRALYMRFCTQCRNCESDASMDRQRRRAADRAVWLPHEVAVLRDYYEAGGSAACKPYLPHRTGRQISNKAQQEGLSYTRPPEPAKSKDDEPLWALPAHDYAPEDLALRQWAAPVSPGPMRWAA